MHLRLAGTCYIAEGNLELLILQPLPLVWRLQTCATTCSFAVDGGERENQTLPVELHSHP